MSKSTKSSSRVKRARDTSNSKKLDKETLINLVKAVVISGVKLTVHVILGIICIQQCRISQSGILPTCDSTAPYTDEKIVMKQIHMDYLTTTDKGVEKSIKATYPVDTNLQIFQDSYILNTIRDWTIGAQSSNFTYYLGTCMKSAAVSYYSMHQNLYGFINSWFPQWLIMYLSFTIIPIVFQISCFWAFCVFVFGSIMNWGLLLELPTITKENPTRKSWRYDHGIWTWPSSPFTILVLLLVICALPLTAGAGAGLVLLLGLSTLFARTQLLYSKKGQINDVMSAVSKSNEVSESNDATPIASATPVVDANPMTGGSSDNDSDKKLTPEEKQAAKQAAKEANCMISNKTTSSKKEIFSITNQIALTFKVYRHIIMIIMTIYMLMDIYSILGVNYLLSGIFAVFIMYYFTDVYKKYKISACDNFTEGLIGYTNSFRECNLEPAEPMKEEEAHRAGFPDIFDKIAKLYASMNPMNAAMGAVAGEASPLGALAGAAEGGLADTASGASEAASGAMDAASSASDAVDSAKNVTLSNDSSK